MRHRFSSALATAVVGTFLVSGCTFGAEIANLEPYDPSDGVGATLENVAIRNAMLFTTDGGEANLVMTVVNTTGEDTELIVQFGEGDSRQSTSVLLPAEPELTQVGTDMDNRVLVEDENIVPGGLFPVYVQYGNTPGEQLNVPVLDGTLPEYELLVP